MLRSIETARMKMYEYNAKVNGVFVHLGVLVFCAKIFAI